MFALLDGLNVSFASLARNRYYIPRFLPAAAPKVRNKQAKKGDIIFVVGDFVDCDGEGYTNWKKTLNTPLRW